MTVKADAIFVPASGVLQTVLERQIMGVMAGIRFMAGTDQQPTSAGTSELTVILPLPLPV